MNGDRPIDSGSTPSSRCSIVALPAATTSSTSSRAMPAVAHTLPSRPSIVADDRRRAAAASASGPCICVWLTRVSTSAPNGACRLIVDSTAAAAPARRSISVATTVVVPTSIETPNERLGRVAGLDVDEPVADHRRGDVESSSSSIAAARRGSTARGVRHLEPLLDERVGDPAEPAARILDRRRLEREQVLHRVRLEQHEPSDAHRRCLGHASSRAARRPPCPRRPRTGTTAASPRRAPRRRGGSRRACARRGPARTCTLHLPHVPRPPHVDSIGMPAQCAALNSVVPGGTCAVVPLGS